MNQFIRSQARGQGPAGRHEFSVWEEQITIHH